MTPKAFNQWLADMKGAGRARFDSDCYDLLGISNAMGRIYKIEGTRQVQTDLACRALAEGLEPYAARPGSDQD